MKRTLYPVKLHALENRRHELVVRKLQAENKLRLLKERIRDAHDRGGDTNALSREREEIIATIHEMDIKLAEVRHTHGSEVVSYKTAFIKMARQVLSRETYREISLATSEFLRECQAQDDSQEGENDS